MAKFRSRRLLKRGPLPLRYVLLLTFVFFIFSTTAGLWIINEELKPTLMSIAKSESVSLATLVINDAIDQQFEQAERKIFLGLFRTRRIEQYSVRY